MDEETGKMIEAAECLKMLVVDAGKVVDEGHIIEAGNNPANAIIAKFGSIWRRKSNIGSRTKRENDSG